MYVILCSWSSLPGYNPAAIYVILCSRFSLPPLQSTLAQCMLFYVPALVSCPFNSGTMYVILCSWYNLPGYNPVAMYVILCPRVSLPILQSTPAHCMLFYVPALVSCPFNTGMMHVILCSSPSLPGYNPCTMFVILCSSYSPLPLDPPQYDVCYSMFLL